MPTLKNFHTAGLLCLALLLAGCPKPSENCAAPGDEDGNGLEDCDDPVCDNVTPCILCGNGVRDDIEACDGDDLAGLSCSDRGFDGGVLVCNDTCTFNVGACRDAICGDGLVEGAEVCDDDNETSGDGCRADCSKLELCGDNIQDVGEQCDDGNNQPGDTCTPECKLPSCGDGTLNPGEDCDDQNTLPEDGCSIGCQIEATFSCTGEPSLCNAAPTGTDDTLAINEDTTLSIQAGLLLFNDLDPERDTLHIIDTFNDVNGTTSLSGDLIVFTPASNLDGVASFEYTLSDGIQESTALVTININAVADSPLLTANNTSGNENSPLLLDINASLTDADASESLSSITLLGLPTGATFNGLSLTPPIGFFGDLNLTAQVTATESANNDAKTSSANFVVTFTHGNQAPVANNQSITTDEDTPKTFTVTATDPESVVLNFALTSNPSKGTLLFNAITGSGTYTPSPNATGADSFTFTASDGALTSNTATISVNINNLNDAPVASDDTLSTNEDTPLPINTSALLVNDSDPEGDTLSVFAVQNSINGQATLSAGNILFTPNPNFHGVASFEYIIFDGLGGVDVALVSINVASINDDPGAQDDLLTTSEGAPVSTLIADLLSNDADIDGDALLFLSFQNASNGVVTQSNNTLTFTPNNNFSGVASFEYTVSDGLGGFADGLVLIAVGQVGSAPTANADSFITNEDSALTINTNQLSINDADPDGDILSVSAVNDAVNGAVSLSGGIVTFTPNANFNGIASFEYTLTDGFFPVTGAVSVTILPVNDQPTANNAATSTTQGNAVTITLTGADIDSGVLQLIAQSIPSHGALSGVTSISATSAQIIYTPDASFVGSDNFTFTSFDGALSSSIATANITINASCGDGRLGAAELCDDGNLIANDGCSSTCTIESGFSCSGSPSSCAAICGDGILTSAETCDDGNLTPNDGCNATCRVEPGFSCTGAPSVCTSGCGDGIIDQEGCDDGNLINNDGCSSACAIESGFACTGAPSVCAAICGDGALHGAETCDDGNTTAGDGCSSSCLEENTCGNGAVTKITSVQFHYAATNCGPPVAVEFLVNGAVIATAAPGGCVCDPGPQSVTVTDPAKLALVQAGNNVIQYRFPGGGHSSAWATMVVTPSVGSPEEVVLFDIGGGDDAQNKNSNLCTAGSLVGADLSSNVAGASLVPETCDDGNLINNDGCSATCAVESGFACSGAPSACATICGDGTLLGDEDCDDGDQQNNDGCSSACEIEPGFICSGAPSECVTVCGDGIVNDVSSVEFHYAATNCGAPGLVEFLVNGAVIATAAPGGCVCDPGPQSVIVTDPAKLALFQSDNNVIQYRFPGDGHSSAWATMVASPAVGSPQEVVLFDTSGGNDAENKNSNICTAGADVGVNTSLTLIGSSTALEFCDDGNLTDGDGCDSNCHVTSCGNGKITPGEGCDDGDLISGDGCSQLCQEEFGFSCDGEPSLCATVCGDQQVNGDEACDDGNLINGDGCGNGCTTELCGDAIVNDDLSPASLSSVTFEWTATKCATSSSKVEFLVNGIVIATGDPGGCVCDPGLRSVTITDPAKLALFQPGDNTIKYRFLGGLNFSGWAVMTARFNDGNNREVVIFDANDGGDAQARRTNVCTAGSTPNLDNTVELPSLKRESCDDGNLINGDGCDNNCNVSTCGNGALEPHPIESIEFQFVSTDCAFEGPIVEFLLNGTVIASAAPGGCVCDPGLLSVVVTDPVKLALYHAGDNTVEYRFLGAQRFSSWAVMRVTPALGAVVETVLFDIGGGGDAEAKRTEICAQASTTNLTDFSTVSSPALPADEGCDDGDLFDGDGCSASCQPEQNFTCTGSPSVCTPTNSNCGNGVINQLGSLQSLTFHYAATNCGAPGSVEFLVNGAVIATAAPGGCVCDPGPQSVTVTDPAKLALVQAGNNVIQYRFPGGGHSSAWATMVAAPSTGAPQEFVIFDINNGGDATAKNTNACLAGSVVGVDTSLNVNGASLLQEGCDDGNLSNNDGCHNDCTPELGFACTGQPSTCNTICADGIILGNETCEETSPLFSGSGDGCSSACQEEGCGNGRIDKLPEVQSIELQHESIVCGNPFDGSPSGLSTFSINGVVVFTRQIIPRFCRCDIENISPFPDSVTITDPAVLSLLHDGSNVFTYTIASPIDGGTLGARAIINKAGLSQTVPIIVTGGNFCAFNEVRGTFSASGNLASFFSPEACDDGNLLDGDGCSSACTFDVAGVCGNGVLNAQETCDDSNRINGDGCNSGCAVETGFLCTGAPSACIVNCGDGLIIGSESCDDGGALSGDGCDAACQEEDNFVCAGQPSICVDGSLFFSEYVEGLNNNKALELFNPFAQPFDLAANDCKINLFANGATTATTIELSGVIQAREAFVIANPGASAQLLAQADAVSVLLTFTGDDALSLQCNGAVVDSIGQIGVDPGAEWGFALRSTQDNTLHRHCDISLGDSITNNDFDGPDLISGDLGAEWDGFAVDNINDLGDHTTCF